MSKSPRARRIAQGVRDILAEMIDREVKDPRVHSAGFVGVNQVELNRDGSVAMIYVSFYGQADDKTIAQAMLGLEASAGFLRGHVARRLNLKRAPLLRFLLDKSPDFHERLSKIMAADAADAADAAERPDVADAAERPDAADAAERPDANEQPDAAERPDAADAAEQPDANERPDAAAQPDDPADGERKGLSDDVS